MLREEIRNIKSTRRDLRNFGFAVGGVILALGFFLLLKERPAAPWLLGLGALLVGFGVLFPAPLKPLQKIWMSFAVVAGWVMTRIILSVLFYLIITPIGLLARIMGKRFLDLTWDDSVESYWNRRETERHAREQDEKQF
jgi:hypothetical protein